VTLVSIANSLARKRETNENQTGNETVSTSNTGCFIGENDDLRKRRKLSGRKRGAAFWPVFVAGAELVYEHHTRNLAAL
jgi:hypothetical protein